jgi:predicted kinase
MTLSDPSIILITGIMAAGKSTVAQALAERLPRSVHLRGDVFRRMIVGGRAALEPPLTNEDLMQLHLRYRIAAQVAEMYCAAGFTVVYQDIILGEDLQLMVDLLKAKRKAYGIVLCPTPEVVGEREAGRGKVGYVGWSPAVLDAELRSNTPRLGLWLDTSAHRRANGRFHPRPN